MAQEEYTYLDAVKMALAEELERDDNVLLMGEDIGIFGGAFKTTEGLIQKFGERRVIDTPLAETAFVGAAIGAALSGLRPVVEVQYADFIVCGFDEIVNMAAKMHYRSGEKVPMVIRGPSGGGVRAGAFHSQNPEAWFVKTPGLKVVAPSTPSDCKGLMKSAIRDDNPVIFFEHKYLYRRVKEVIPNHDYTVPLGKAHVKVEGDHVSVITYGAMVHKALEAAAALKDKGISLEVVDLRTLLPLDKETILNSVAKTNRAIILHEDTRTLGVGAEVAAMLADEGFDYLAAPVSRVTAPDTPVPFSPPLEDFFLPQTEQIIMEAERLMTY